jgi:glycosyltransferase involved in cell wall biosynthesis
MRTKPHVVFFTAHLGGGGAEMHLVRLLNAIDREHWSLEVVVARGGGNYESQLAADIPLTPLFRGIESSTLSLTGAIPLLRRYLAKTKPDLICAVMDHANVVALVAARGLGIPVVLNVQVSPLMEYRRRLNPMSAGLRAAIRWLYPDAARVVALSSGVANELQQMSPKLGASTVVIFNASLDQVVLDAVRRPIEHQRAPGEKLLVACGRLTYQKGFPTLLEALAIVRKSVDARLWILGEGADRAALEAQARELGIERAVELLGFRPEPYRYMATADLFVLSSRYEGLGLVLVEAMAAGAAVVSTDCPHGPREVLRGGLDGVLVPVDDAARMAQAIVALLDDPNRREALIVSAKDRALDFHATRVAAAFMRLFSEVLREHALQHSRIAVGS